MFPFARTPYVFRAVTKNGKFTFLGAIFRLFVIMWVTELIASLPTFALAVVDNFQELYVLVNDYAAGRLTPDQYSAVVESLFTESLGSPIYEIASLVGMVVVGAGAFFYMLVLDKRPFYQMALTLNKKEAKFLPLFFLGGIVAAGILSGVLFLSGALQFTLTTPTLLHLAAIPIDLLASSAYLFFFLGAFLPVALSHTKVFWRTVIWTSVLLGLYITPNYADSWIGIINGMLLSLFLVLLTVRTGSLWSSILSYGGFVLASHILFGDGVYHYLTSAIFNPLLTAGRELTHGGLGGYLNGIGATLVIALAFLPLLYRAKPKEDTNSGSFEQSTL